MSQRLSIQKLDVDELSHSGFGTQMSDAKMVILWPNMDGTVTLSQRTATGLVEPDPDPNPPRVATLFQPLTIVSQA